MIVLEALSIVAESNKANFGYLVDEEYGARAAIEAKNRNIILAMPVEASRTPEMILQYGDDFAEHILKFKPDIVKTLIFHSKNDEAGRKERQFNLLATLQEWCQENNFKFMVEILVNQAQSKTLENIKEFGLFPELKSAIVELAESGISPNIWKIEGLDSEDHTRQIGELKFLEENNSELIVLGSGASLNDVGNWVENAAKAQNYSGFAVGRSIWQLPISMYFDGKLTKDKLTLEIAQNFKSLVNSYETSLK
jgi:5-dehydro-2-deoxygluconokinase